MVAYQRRSRRQLLDTKWSKAPRVRSRFAHPIALALGLLLTVSACTSDRDKDPEPDLPIEEPSAAPIDAWDALEARSVADGDSVSVDLALDAFATLIAPIPGGEAEPGGVGPGQSGTIAIRWILGVWSQLEPLQRAAVQSAVLGEQVVQQPPNVSPTSGGAATTPGVSSNEPFARAHAGSQRARALRVPRTSDALTAGVTAELNRISDDLSTFYNLPGALYDVYVSPTPDAEQSIASAVPVELDELPGVPNFQFHGRSRWCRITVYPPGVEIFEDVKAGKAGTFSYDMSFLAHELYHCIQFTYFNDVALMPEAPGWLLEGSAEWAQYKWIYDSTETAYQHPLPGRLSSMRTKAWNLYLGAQADPTDAYQDSLYARDYSAGGFYAHMDNFGINPWLVVPTMIRALTPTTSLNDEYALQAAVPGDDAAKFWQDWAMGLTRTPDLGDAWEASGPGITAYRHEPEDHRVDGTISGIGAGPGAVGLTSLPAAAERHELFFENRDDAVLVIRVAAYGSFAWIDAEGRIVEDRFAPDPEAGFARHSYCLDPGGCTCEDGTPIPMDPPVEPAPMLEPYEAYVSFTGGHQQGSINVRLFSPEQLCEPTAEPPPAGPLGDCRHLTERQVGEIVGQRMTYISSASDPQGRVCTWSSLGVVVDDRSTVLNVGGVQDAPAITWEQLRARRTTDGYDCTATVAGLRSCVSENGPETEVDAWISDTSRALGYLRVGANVTSPIATHTGRLAAMDAALRALLDENES